MPNNNDFETQLQRAMKRSEAPADFANRVFAIAGLPEKKPSFATRLANLLSPRGSFALAGGACAAALCVGSVLAYNVHQQHERERVEQQYAEAMRITDHALDHARNQLERAGIQLQ